MICKTPSCGYNTPSCGYRTPSCGYNTPSCRYKTPSCGCNLYLTGFGNLSGMRVN